MNQSYLAVILALLATIADAASIMTCKENAMCSKGECCLEGICTPFIPVGKKCNILDQIMRVQCPCAIGSSCLFTATKNFDEMSCQNIPTGKYLEVVENNDLKHIEMNKIEE